MADDLLSVQVDAAPSPIDERVASATQAIKRHLREVPVVVKWSSGKDSSVTLNLTLNAGRELRQAGEPVQPIVVQHGNTGIENPEIAVYARAEMERVYSYAAAHGLDVRIHTAEPSLNDRWAVRVIGGRALPTFPNKPTRDCTVDMKIRPMERASTTILKSLGLTDRDPVNVLGTRFSESAGRGARMRERGENAEDVRIGQKGRRYISPIADWDTDDVWWYLGECRSGRRSAYSDFDETFRLYADAAGTTCAVVGDALLDSAGRGGGCGARHGCALCTVVQDKSLENMIEGDPRYGYMRELNRLQRFLLATQNDMSRRNWIGRTIKDGFIRIAPDAYSPAMMRDLLQYALTIDVREKEAAFEAGLSAPRFELVDARSLIAIDAFWSLQGFHKPFEALRIYRDIYINGARYDVPVMASEPAGRMPEERFFYVGTDWDEGREYQYTGLNDVLIDGFGGSGCMGKRTLKDGKTVLDVQTADMFDIDEEAAYLILDLELDRLCDMDTLTMTAGYRYYVSLGALMVQKSQIAKADEMLRRTSYKERHGLYRLTAEDIAQFTVSRAQRDRGVQYPELDGVTPQPVERDHVADALYSELQATWRGEDPNYAESADFDAPFTGLLDFGDDGYSPYSPSQN